MKAYGIEVKTAHPEIKEGEIAGARWSELAINGNHPSKITLNIRIIPHKPDDTVFAIRGATGVPLDRGIFYLNVPVTWENGIPRTRREPEDNVDIVFLDSDGFFTELQVGLITRGGKFFTTIQRIWRGWVVFPKEGETQYIPAEPDNSYPGSSFKMIDIEKEEILKLAGLVATNINKALGGNEATPIASKWKPQLPSPKLSWERGNVLFFNLVTGTGIILAEDDEKFLVHFSRILPNNGNPMKVLAPLQGVYFRPEKEPLETGEIRKVKSCLPA